MHVRGSRTDIPTIVKLASDVANFSSKFRIVDLLTVYLQAYRYFIQISTVCITEFLVLIVYI